MLTFLQWLESIEDYNLKRQPHYYLRDRYPTKLGRQAERDKAKVAKTPDIRLPLTPEERQYYEDLLQQLDKLGNEKNAYHVRVILSTNTISPENRASLRRMIDAKNRENFYLNKQRE